MTRADPGEGDRARLHQTAVAIDFALLTGQAEAMSQTGPLVADDKAVRDWLRPLAAGIGPAIGRAEVTVC